MNIFFYGGTFDPPHIGHYNIVKYCLEFCEKFIIIPTKQSPHKASKPEVKNKHRINMLNYLFEDFTKINIDPFELESEHINYTFLTINYLKNKFTNCNLTMVIGYDQLLKLEQWKNYKQILNDVNILCFNRKINDKLKYSNKKIKFISSFNYNISSREIRENFKNNNFLNLANMLDRKIIKYISKNNLYES